MGRNLVAAAMVAAAVAVAAVVAAGPATGQTGDEAKQSFQKGVDLYNEGDYQGALAEFLSAYELKPHHSVLYNIAQCYQMIDSGAKAIQFYEQYLEDGADFIKEKRKNQVIEEIEKLKAMLTPTTLAVTPDGADVSVDGKIVGQSPLPGVLYLDPGEHVILVEKDGFAPQKQTFVAKRGDAIAFEISLAAEVLTGLVSVKSGVEGATATLDGEEIGELPAEKIVDAGEHEVVVSAPGHVDAKKTVVVEKGGKAEVAIDPKPVPAAPPVVAPAPVPEPAPIAGPEKSQKYKSLKGGAISMGVIGFLAAGLAAGAGVSAARKKDEFMDFGDKVESGVYSWEENKGKYEDLADEGRELNGAFVGLLAGSAACMALMLVLAPLAAKEAKKGGTGKGGGEEQPEKAAADFMVVPGWGGATVTVAF